MSRRVGRVEKDTCRDFVLPALAAAGWGPDMIRAEFPVAADRVMSRGGLSRDIGDGRVDYLLEAVPGVAVALVEAKREYRQPKHGLQQAIRYGMQLDVPVVYATNGRGIVEHNFVTGAERAVESVATPAELWSLYAEFRGLDDDGMQLVCQPFNRRRTTAAGDVVSPRWYQAVAVHRVLQAIATGRDRVLLLMATGTGKTFTAMQIVAKLRGFEAIKHPERNYRVLYLADLDVLLSSPMKKDFMPAFGSEPLHRVKGGASFSREIYFASYQAMTGQGDADALFGDYPRDFFDLVIVDECHRGSASADSSWRRVLDHFATAVQLGLTATPKQDAEVDSYEYFGDPVFTYSLRQGIEEGYLAPYRVRRVVLSPDADGWSPSPGELDRFGRDIPEGKYSTKDFERAVSLVARTRLAARHLSATLRQDPSARTMVFCVDMEHAQDMRTALVEANPDLVRDDPEWVVRIVGDEPEKVRLLEAFMDPEASTPVVATTSKMLSTGVDVEDLKLVVLFRPVGSMVEFKQIIGRGTRLYPEKGKTSFEIIDYVGASAKFSDPDFDGVPIRVRIESVDADGDVTTSTEVPTGVDTPESPQVMLAEPVPPFLAHNPDEELMPGTGDSLRGKLYVDDGEFEVVAEARLVPDLSTGRTVLVEYRQYVAGAVRAISVSAEEFTERWSSSTTREAVLAELASRGVVLSELGGDDASDPLDLLLQAAWNVPGLTRSERVRRVRTAHAGELAALSATARNVLSALLDRYATHGVEEIMSGELLVVEPFRTLGSPTELAGAFGGAAAWHESVERLQAWLYSA